MAVKHCKIMIQKSGCKVQLSQKGELKSIAVKCQHDMPAVGDGWDKSPKPKGPGFYEKLIRVKPFQPDHINRVDVTIDISGGPETWSIVAGTGRLLQTGVWHDCERTA